MPTAPSEYGSPAAHWTLSYPSVASWWLGVNSPSEVNRPRTSCRTTTYPWRTTRSGSKYMVSSPESRPYGVRLSSTGYAPGPAGRYTVDRNTTPSRIGASTSYSTCTSVTRASVMITLRLVDDTP